MHGDVARSTLHSVIQCALIHITQYRIVEQNILSCIVVNCCVKPQVQSKGKANSRTFIMRAYIEGLHPKIFKGKLELHIKSSDVELKNLILVLGGNELPSFG